MSTLAERRKLKSIAANAEPRLPSRRGNPYSTEPEPPAPFMPPDLRRTREEPPKVPRPIPKAPRLPVGWVAGSHPVRPNWVVYRHDSLGIVTTDDITDMDACELVQGSALMARAQARARFPHINAHWYVLVRAGTPRAVYSMDSERMVVFPGQEGTYLDCNTCFGNMIAEDDIRNLNNIYMATDI